jgi:hypothetical protein
MSFQQKLEQRYGIKGWWQISIIFIVFAVTGSSSMILGRYILSSMGITEDTEWYIRIPLKIFLVFFVYQFLLIIFGTIAGQFKFFWNMELRILNFVLKPFGVKIREGKSKI